MELEETAAADNQAMENAGAATETAAETVMTDEIKAVPMDNASAETNDGDFDETGKEPEARGERSVGRHVLPRIGVIHGSIVECGHGHTVCQNGLNPVARVGGDGEFLVFAFDDTHRAARRHAAVGLVPCGRWPASAPGLTGEAVAAGPTFHVRRKKWCVS